MNIPLNLCLKTTSAQAISLSISHWCYRHAIATSNLYLALLPARPYYAIKLPTLPPSTTTTFLFTYFYIILTYHPPAHFHRSPWRKGSRSRSRSRSRSFPPRRSRSLSRDRSPAADKKEDENGDMSRYREWDLSCKVYVGNLGNNSSKNELEDVFSKYGPIRNVWVARNPPGFAFIEFEDPRDAEDAVRGLDGMRCCGTRIIVEMSNGKSRRNRRRTSPSYSRRSRSRSPWKRNSRPRSRSPRSRSRSRSPPPRRDRSRSFSRERR